MSNHVIVWDLETVPDLRGFAAANDLVGKSDDEIREAMGDKFPKHIYHSIVCIDALIAHQESDHWVVDALGAPHVGERPEKELIASFVDRIAELKPQLVTFKWIIVRSTRATIPRNGPQSGCDWFVGTTLPASNKPSKMFGH
jgi:3'-5' exonuclease